MKRKKAVRLVTRSFGIHKIGHKVRGRHRNGQLELVLLTRSGKYGGPGREEVVARGKTWETCVSQLCRVK